MNSSGLLLSPEIENFTSSPKNNNSENSETDRFYRLKKDSQRRKTLSKVLALDENKICELWMHKIESDHSTNNCIEKTHLEILIQGLRDYIITENQVNLEVIVNELKKLLKFDETALDQLHLALYSFQDSVVTVLRSHYIKPHWMFALDNLVKRAVQAGVMILSPGENTIIFMNS